MKKIIFCLPGREYSGAFLKSWSQLLGACVNQGINNIIYQHYSPIIYYARNICLGGELKNGIHQKPFQGEVDYDYIMWIDSDIVFNPSHFFKLLSADKDIVSGVYKMHNNFLYTVSENWDEDYFQKYSTYEFMTKKTLSDKKGLFKAAFVGFGWTLFKKGVFESLEFPWFKPIWKEWNHNGVTIKDIMSEDISICYELNQKGYDIWVDPEVIVGHEKPMIL